MAHQTPNAWIERQKFDVKFDAVESGSRLFNAEWAAAAVAQRSGIEYNKTCFQHSMPCKFPDLGCYDAVPPFSCKIGNCVESTGVTYGV